MDIKVADDLWASIMLPEGTMERWLVPNGASVSAGDPIAEIRIEDARHEIISLASGYLTIRAAIGSLVEPGTLIGHLDQADRS
jgi:pyruvate/2-oxoglutarate dehydrogenase complex dihydrolipoamide acyltransferase (E2) component